MTARTIVGLATLGVWLGLTGIASATLENQRNAKAAGFPAANCLYCHNEKLPRKGAATHNERGKWLLAEKEKHKAKQIDVNWLKAYPGK